MTQTWPESRDHVAGCSNENRPISSTILEQHRAVAFLLCPISYFRSIIFRPATGRPPFMVGRSIGSSPCVVYAPVHHATSHFRYQLDARVPRPVMMSGVEACAEGSPIACYGITATWHRKAPRKIVPSGGDNQVIHLAVNWLNPSQRFGATTPGMESADLQKANKARHESLQTYCTSCKK